MGESPLPQICYGDNFLFLFWQTLLQRSVIGRGKSNRYYALDKRDISIVGKHDNYLFYTTIRLLIFYSAK